MQRAAGIEQRHEAADGAVLIRKYLEHPVQRGLEVERARKRLRDVEEGRQALRLALARIGTRDILVDRHIEGDVFVGVKGRPARPP